MHWYVDLLCRYWRAANGRISNSRTGSPAAQASRTANQKNEANNGQKSLQYTAAVKTATLDSTSKALATLSDVFRKDPKLPLILTAPTLSPGDKTQIVQELQRHMGGGGDKGDTVKNFLRTLAENNRLGILEGVCEKFTVLMGAARGEVDLTVTSAAVSNARCWER